MFARYRVEIGIKKKFKVQGKLTIFEARLKGSTRKHQVYDCLGDVRQVLELPLLQLYEAGTKIFIVASEQGVTINNLIDILRSSQFTEATKRMEIPYAVGSDAIGNKIIVDLRELPHLIIGGSTKMGKTVALWCLLLSILIGCPPDKASLLIYDGAANLTMFDGFPHLLHPVIQQPETGFELIMGLEYLMEQRLARKESVDTRFYSAVICVIDEFLSLLNGLDKDQVKQFAAAISRLMRSGRQADIHVIAAIHNPIKDSTKSKTSMRTFPLLADVREVLLKLKDKQDENRRIFGNTYYSTDYIFKWQDGRLYRPDYITKSFQRVLKKNDLKKIRFHDLRHSCASLLLSLGYSMKDIQEWVRHVPTLDTKDKASA